MDLKTLNFPELIRYFVTGFNFLVLVVSPIVISKDYGIFIELNKSISSIVIITSAFIIGFIIDQMKIYQFIIGYSTIKKEFRNKIQEALNIENKFINTYFSYITNYAKKYSFYNLEKKRAEWILAINTSIMLIFTIIFWFILYLFDFLNDINFYIFIIYPIIALKLYFTAKEELIKSNKEFLLFCEKNKQNILDSIELKEKQKVD
ncbi:MAG: hypothetical protein ACNI25_04355 [Halarcobacter sp.]